jgi:hypothetical protein
MQPDGQAVAQPATYSTVFGPVHPQGMARFSWNVQFGTGHRITAQSAGEVVRVTVGHGVVVGRGGSVVMLMTKVGELVVELLVEVVLAGVVVEVVLRVCVLRRVDEVVVVELVITHGRFWLRNSTPQPLYGQAALHGARSVAVGTDAGQPHGLSIVEINMQFALLQDLACAQVGLSISCVMVGQEMSASAAMAKLPEEES